MLHQHHTNQARNSYKKKKKNQARNLVTVKTKGNQKNEHIYVSKLYPLALTKRNYYLCLGANR